METATDTEKLTKLRKIKSNTSYYAGYFLRKIDGKFLMLGSVPTEENYSSIISFFWEKEIVDGLSCTI